MVCKKGYDSPSFCRIKVLFFFIFHPILSWVPVIEDGSDFFSLVFQESYELINENTEDEKKQERVIVLMDKIDENVLCESRVGALYGKQANR